MLLLKDQRMLIRAHQFCTADQSPQSSIIFNDLKLSFSCGLIYVTIHLVCSDAVTTMSYSKVISFLALVSEVAFALFSLLMSRAMNPRFSLVHSYIPIYTLFPYTLAWSYPILFRDCLSKWLCVSPRSLPTFIACAHSYTQCTPLPECIPLISLTE